MHRSIRSRVSPILLAGSLLFTSSICNAENAMGYTLLSTEEAARLPANHGSLGMDVERSRQITDNGMTFDIIRIRQLRPRSPAAGAGFQAGDQIIAVNGRVFPSIASFGAYIGSMAPGSRAVFDYIPAGQGPGNAQRLTVSMGAAGTPAAATSWTTGQKVAIGVGAAALLGCYELGCFAPRRQPTTQVPGR